MLSVQKGFPLIQKSILHLSVVVIAFSWYLLLNDGLDILNVSIFNNTLVNDYLSFSSKGIIFGLSFGCMLVIQQYLLYQRLNNFEYSLVILFSILGLLVLCSANDLITAYLAIELQSLSFYVLAAFSKNSSYSVESGLKYFILGAFHRVYFY